MIDAPTPRDTWWVAMWSQELTAGQMVARRIMNEPLVFFRTEDGRPSALLDRCAHRWAPLSRGKLNADDRIVCPYHGLEYDAHGVCVKNPHPNYAIPSMMRVRSYPLAEKHSAIWIWMGEGDPNPALIPDFSMLDAGAPDPVSKRDYLLMHASWDLITDNLLDLSHVAFLHDGLLATPEYVEAETSVEQHASSVKVKRDMKNVPVSRFFDLMLFGNIDGSKPTNSNVDVPGGITWHAPACLINEARAVPAGAPVTEAMGIRGIHFLTPETDTTSHYHFAASLWNVPSRGKEVDAEVMRQVADLRRIAFVEQDEAIIAAQQLRVSEAGKEHLRAIPLVIDAGIERVHRILRDMCEQERPQRISAS